MFDVRITTPEREYYNGGAYMVVMPGKDGVFGVLSNHIPLLAAMDIGVVKIIAKEGEAGSCYAVSGGYAEFDGQKLSILVDSIEHAAEIDAKRAKKALGRAEDRIGSGPEATDILRAKVAMAKAVNRMKVSSEHQS